MKISCSDGERSYKQSLSELMLVCIQDIQLLRSKDHSRLMQTLHSVLHRPNSKRTGWLVPVQAAGISEVTVHREKEIFFCVISQAPQVYYYYFYY